MVVGLRIERLLEMLLEKEGRRANHSLMPCRCALVDELLLTAAEAQRPCRPSPCTLHAHVLARSAATGHCGGAAPLHGCAAAAEVRTQPPPTNVEAAADQRGGVAHLQAQRVHARLPPAAAEADLATAGCHSLLGNARRRRVFNDGSWGQGHGRMGSSWALGGPGAKLGHSGQSCKRGGRWRQYYFRAKREEVDNLLRIFFLF